ncbi:862_t:CDS:2 [Funneliformis geosporum]|uniref:14084_t:CDS:1 n=1 Tax=Funneliformis geosporum TaxID=1117311 RepID=A0A9W4T7M8_9GLOM|nr:862_t:CDS:2 [Funneliformis geosporum]CAI2195711.1 14084_t:CDS:2 [Funneliformis geosporum]
MNTPPLNETKLVDKRNTHVKTSWIWDYWIEDVCVKQGQQRQIIICQVIIDDNQNICGKTYIRSRGSTGNATSHLRNQHRITKDGKIDKSDDLEQDVMVHRRQYSKEKQQELCQFLVD